MGGMAEKLFASNSNKKCARRWAPGMPQPRQEGLCFGGAGRPLQLTGAELFFGVGEGSCECESAGPSGFLDVCTGLSINGARGSTGSTFGHGVEGGYPAQVRPEGQRGGGQPSRAHEVARRGVDQPVRHWDAPEPAAGLRAVRPGPPQDRPLVLLGGGGIRLPPAAPVIWLPVPPFFPV